MSRTLETYAAGLVGGAAIYHFVTATTGVSSDLRLAGIFILTLFVIVVFLSFSSRNEMRRTSQNLWDARSVFLDDIRESQSRLEMTAQAILDGSKNRSVD